MLDPESDTYALDVVSVIEATLDDPRQILSAQLNKARGEAVAAMKAEGIEYDERMELLDDVTYPKPLEELLEAPSRSYLQSHPWVGDFAAVAEVGRARDVRAGDDVPRVRHFYGLARSEGAGAALPVRRLQGAAVRPCPTTRKTEELTDLIEWLGELVRQVDSSLLDEWEQLTNPDRRGARGASAGPTTPADRQRRGRSA